MTSLEEQIHRTISALVGLPITGVNHAADMLTLTFGPLRSVVTERGTEKQVGAWALHIQCDWQIEQHGHVVATEADLFGSGENQHATTDRLEKLLIEKHAAIVERIHITESAAVQLALSQGLSIFIQPGSNTEVEDWRFFAPYRDDDHFVIQGGCIEPDAL